jgi:hypothetical protein
LRGWWQNISYDRRRCLHFQQLGELRRLRPLLSPPVHPSYSELWARSRSHFPWSCVCCRTRRRSRCEFLPITPWLSFSPGRTDRGSTFSRENELERAIITMPDDRPGDHTLCGHARAHEAGRGGGGLERFGQTGSGDGVEGELDLGGPRGCAGSTSARSSRTLARAPPTTLMLEVRLTLTSVIWAAAGVVFGSCYNV